MEAATVTLEKENRGMASQQGDEEEGSEEKWLQYYSSLHQILIVGDGDFSFSLCLANSFCSASNIVASSLDSYAEVTRKYKNAKSNIEKLERLGTTPLHGVDATQMKFHTDLGSRKFDRIIFNFPHAGFRGKEDNDLLIRKHKNLVSGFFRNASGVLRADGEIHVNHKTTYPFSCWDIPGLASESSLILIECIDFNITDYPGYNNKRGDSLRCDEPFPLGDCSTFKFILSPHKHKTHIRRPLRIRQDPCPRPRFSTTFDGRCSLNAHNVMNRSSQCVGFLETSENWPLRAREAPFSKTQLSTTFDGQYSFNNQTMTNGSCRCVGSLEKECFLIFDGYLSRVIETFGRADYNVESSFHSGLELGFRKYMGGPGSTVDGYINRLEQLHHLSRLRSAWLRDILHYLDQRFL